MLLKNFLHNYKLINGSNGIVKEIIFKHRNGHSHMPHELRACVIIESKQKYLCQRNETANYFRKKTFQFLQ